MKQQCNSCGSENLKGPNKVEYICDDCIEEDLKKCRVCGVYVAPNELSYKELYRVYLKLKEENRVLKEGLTE